MYIEPSTEIIILQDVPLDTTYKHSIYFANETAQQTYFKSKKKYHLTKQSYQRVNKGVTRVNIKAEELYNCNYLMFRNDNFGNKWFYAFIKSVEYINNIVSEITFEIDVLQSWFFDFNLEQSFVEREHSATDNIGDNIVSEPLQTGEYILSNYKKVGNLNWSDLCVVVSIVDNENKDTKGYLYDGVYSGSFLRIYDSSDDASLTELITKYIDKPDSILSMYMCPKCIFKGNNDIEKGGELLPYGFNGIEDNYKATAIKGNETFDGYKPKNKKLYTYPYNYYNIDNGNGGTLALRYEFFENLQPVIKIMGNVTQPIKVIARPCNYKGVPSYDSLQGYTTLNTETITLESYPQCSWNVDSFKAWLAQNSVPMLMNTGLSMITSIATGDVTSTIGSVTNNLKSMYTPSIQADVCKGNTNIGNINCSKGLQQFNGCRMHVTKEMAMVIDDFFTMYGYQTNKVKIPNISKRPHWNYVKTVDVNINGSLPCDDLNKICGIFDSGITFWKNGNEVGNYSLDNSI